MKEGVGSGVGFVHVSGVGSGSISQRYGSADLDVTDSQHWILF
jgi:hypothetical protein